MQVSLFGLNLKINPIAFKVGDFPIYWYGVIIGLGFLLAILYGLKNADRFGLDKDRMLDVVLVTTPVAILSARAYFCIFPYDNGSRITTFKEFFGIGTNEGFRGLAIYGGIIGAFGVGLIMCLMRKVNILDMFDIAALGFLIGQGIGRWGNFFNQEAFGVATGSNWFGMKSAETGDVFVHPCFLYESIWCILGFVLLHYVSKNRKFKGQIVCMYGAWYGFARFFIESIRTDSLMLGKMRVSMLLSALLFIGCVSLLVFLFNRYRKANNTVEYEAMFKEQMDDYQEENSSNEALQTDNV